ncbi:SusC/RagA family TonB-linked outer membrane protein [Pedobacter ureilyticus]|uniref:SusC/RagA family TonB-linked outer membrane protein n=1 Tax=Pedobacter ureilyticus TaxID=1393051 RepID=A0ABW9J9S8_9SPHI|nr:SusC/RagA family TonB-linked outer membrane protein [Pedobacter helvus]
MKIEDQKDPWHSAWANNPLVRAMKLTMIIMTVFLMQLSATGLAQNVTFKKNNSSLKEFFTEIRKQTGYHVVWQEGKVNDAIRISVAFQSTPLEQALEQVLSAKNLDYKIVNKTVVVKPKEKGMLDRIKSYFAKITVSGKVVDAETNLPMPGVTVRVTGTNKSAVTDASGLFEIPDVDENAALTLSSIGYASKSMAVQENMLIRLAPITQELEGVVISTGYQEIKKQSTTGAANVITAKEIEETPSINLMERLEGKIPGVQFDIRKNTIQVRGTSSYTAKAPLVVIDGFPAVNQDLTTITSGVIESRPRNKNQPETSGNAILSTFNPADIESISFLKDAAASAIWGASAANGVIVITTKRGRKGKSAVNFSATTGFSGPAKLSDLNSMTNAQYIELEQELVDKNFIQDPVANLIASPLNGWRSAPVTEAQEWMFKAKRNPALIPQRDAALKELANRSNHDQIRDYLLQNAIQQQYNLSFSGGQGNSAYYVSGNYTKDRPVFRSNEAEKYAVLSNLTNNFLNNRLIVTAGVNYAYSKSQVNTAAISALSEGALGLAPYELLVDANGNRIRKGVAFTTRTSDSLTRVRNLLPWTYNAIDELAYGNTVNTANSVRINSSVKGVITKWMNFTVSGQLQKSFEEQVNLKNQNSYYTRNLINSGTNQQNVALLGSVYGVPKGGIYQAGRVNRNDYGLRAQLDINKDFGTDHHFDMIAGAEIREEKGQGSEQMLYGYDEELSTSVNVNTVGNAARYYNIYGNLVSLGQPNNLISRYIRRYLSYYGNASYSFLGKYHATASARFDDVNVVGVSRKARATPLWSAGLRWDIFKEDFMSGIRWISGLSLRSSIGLSGNVPDRSANFTTVNLGLVDGYTQLPYARIGFPLNQDLGWEITNMANIGLDVAILNNRVNVTFDYYRKHVSDLLINLPINSTYGWQTLDYNAGTLESHGVDLGITAELLRAKDFKWSLAFNYGYNTNKVTEARFQPQIVTGVAITPGYAVDNMWVYRWAGLDNLGRSQIYDGKGNIKSSVDNNIVTEDRVAAGRTVAPHFGGLINTFSYKGWTLMARATYNLGHKFLIQNISPGLYPTSGSYSGIIGNNAAIVDRWRNPGDEAFTNVPGLSNVNVNSITRYIYSDLNVRDAGQIRLQQISLTYVLPSRLLKTVPFIKGVNLGATVSNLGLIWVANKEGIDPDYQMTSMYNNLPPTRNYVFNVNLTL